MSSSFGEEKVFNIMGTYLIIDTEKYHYDIYRYILSLEKILSDYIEYSDISKINNSAGDGCVEVSEETIDIIRKSIHISELTNGAFDITVGSITINYKRKGTLQFEEAKNLINYKDIEIVNNKVCLRRKGMAIDVGGIGKGYAIEKSYQKFKDRIDKGFIALAGDMRVWGQRRKIGIYNPINKNIIATLINKIDICVSTSGNYFQEHIVGNSTDLLQVTVAYTECSYADAISTAIFAMEKKHRENFLSYNKDFAIFILYKDGSIWLNKKFLEYFDILNISNLF